MLLVVAAVIHREHPTPDGKVCPAVEAGEKRACFNHKTMVKEDYRWNLHSNCNNEYETIEGDYEFNSIDDYEMLE